MIERIHEIFETTYGSYKNDVTTLSLDDDNAVSLCYSERRFFDYDAIVQQIAQIESEDSLSSSDIIHFKENKVIFIEFKNGKIDSKTKKELKIKGIEGGFIALYKAVKRVDSSASFNDIVVIPKEYCIVYNSQRNPNSRITAITQHMESVRIRFSMEKYQGTFFERVLTVSEDIFDDKVLSQI
jgi:hypothetical protein